MGKYLFQASYTLQGVKGLLASGGSAREKAIVDLVESVGGNLEAFYYAFGDDDLLVIAELPDDAAAAAISLGVATTGAGTIKTTVLLGPSTIDDASKRVIDYTPPGS